MKRLLLGILFLCAGMSSVGYAQQGIWITDAKAAFESARAQNKPLLIYFTGSDWCIWCKRLDSQILNKPEFWEAAKGWVLLKADFPKFSSQPELVKKHNQSLLQIYSVQGFPTLVFTDGNGNELGRHGYTNVPASVFITELKSIAGN